jgi:hypothetical protein
MKMYSFELDGKKYKLTGLTQEVKEEFVDEVRAKLLKRAQRMLAKKLINTGQFVRLETVALGTSFHSQAVLDELNPITGEVGWKRLFGLMLLPEDAGTTEFLDKMWVEQSDPKSSLAAAIILIYKDAFPNDTKEVTAEEAVENDDPKVEAGTPTPTI